MSKRERKEIIKRERKGMRKRERKGMSKRERKGMSKRKYVQGEGEKVKTYGAKGEEIGRGD